MFTLKQKDPESKIHAFTDNSSALGWLYKARFNSASQYGHDKVTRKFASFMIAKDFSLYSKHIMGQENFIADEQSRNFDSSKNEPTKILPILYPKQAPPNFYLVNLPEDLSSWISSTLEETITKRGLESRNPESHQPTSINGKNSAENLRSKMSSFQSSQTYRKSKLCAHLQQQSTETFLEKLRKKNCSESLLETHSDTFVRSLGLTAMAIRELMNTEIQT